MTDLGRVVIVQYSAALDGSAHSGLLLADGLREAGWKTHVAFGFEGPIIERYAMSGHETYVVPHDNWLRRTPTHQFAKDAWLEWKAAAAFDALIEKTRPDIVYVNTVVSLAAALAARRKDVPCVWHLREMWADVGGEMQAPNWAVPIVRRLVRGHADKLVANSTATAQNLLGNGVEDVAIVPNAVRASFFEEDRSQEAARAAFDFPSGVPIIGVPGTLRPMKGHLFFFEAVAPLLQERGGLKVAVTGDGEDEFVRQLKAQVDALGVREQVHFLGWVEDMPAFYRACDLVCVPSRAEPFGRTAIEAFAVGAPVVATAVGGLQEIVTDEATGMLVDYGDQMALLDAVCGLLDDPGRRRKMSVHARQAAEERYHESVYKDRIGMLIATVCGHGHSVPRT